MLTAKAAFSGISVDDIAAAKEFYIEKLDLELLNETMGLDVELPLGARLFIYEKANHTPANFTVLNFVVDDIDTAVDELALLGIAMERYDNLGTGVEQDDKGILRGLAAGMGPDIAWFKDPAGNVLAVLQEK